MDRRGILYIIGGAVLLLGAYIGLAWLPEGPSEFAYHPYVPAPLPFAPNRGFTFEQLVEHLLRVLLAAPGLALLCVGIARAQRFGAWAPSPSWHRRLALGVSMASLGMMAYMMLFVFAGRAILDDTLTYRMQAMLWAEGRLGSPDPPLYFLENFTVLSRVGFTGKYLFGEPLVQFPGALLGVPALLHLPLAALALWLWYRVVQISAGTVVACWAVILVACSPMFVYTGATGQSQPTSLFAMALAGYGYVQLAHRRPWLGALALGMGVGFGMTIRPQAMAPVGTVLVAVAMIRALGRRRLGPALLLLAGLGLWAGLILLYNKTITGSPLTLPWFLLEQSERYGFGRVYKGADFFHTPLTALENLVVASTRFNAWWLGWPASLLLFWYWFRSGRSLDGALIWLAAGAAIILFEIPYVSTGVSDTGATYHFELLLPAAILGANAVRQAFRSAPRTTALVLTLHFGLGSLGFFAFHHNRLQRLVTTIHKDSDRALAAITDRPALLLYEVHPAESLRVGWVFEAFPRRNRSRFDSVVTYPRPPRRHLEALLRHYRDRSCWYYRRHPETGRAEIYPCGKARHLINRPYSYGPGDSSLTLKSTAESLGLYDPWGEFRRLWSRKNSFQNTYSTQRRVDGTP